MVSVYRSYYDARPVSPAGRGLLPDRRKAVETQDLRVASRVWEMLFQPLVICVFELALCTQRNKPLPRAGEGFTLPNVPKRDAPAR